MPGGPSRLSEYVISDPSVVEGFGESLLVVSGGCSDLDMCERVICIRVADLFDRGS